MPNELKPGDVVALKSGGPEMTIERVCADGDMQCVWMADAQTADRATFKPAALKPTRPPLGLSPLERAAAEFRAADEKREAALRSARERADSSTRELADASTEMHAAVNKLHAVARGETGEEQAVTKATDAKHVS